MPEKTKDQSCWTSREGASSEPGKAINPSELPEDAPDDSTEIQDVDIGHTVSPEEYKRLKKRAKKSNPRSRRTAQEDPSTEHKDGE